MWLEVEVEMMSCYTPQEDIVLQWSMTLNMLFSGRRFYAHRIALLASSDAFRAMFDGGYRVSLQLSIVCAGCFGVYWYQS